MMKNSVKKSSLLFIFLVFVLAQTSVSSFAAANKKKRGGNNKRSNKSKSASTNKGFGAPPPTLEEVLSKFRTRIPDDVDNQECPCKTNPGSLYKDCCGPLHRSEKLCLSIMDVLKSRYTAFKFRNIGRIIKTTHPTCRDYRDDMIVWAKDLNKQGMFDSYEFVNLEVGPEEEAPNNADNEGYINFKATLQSIEDPTQETTISERSKFLKDPADGSWSYSSGDVRSEVAGLEDVILN